MIKQQIETGFACYTSVVSDHQGCGSEWMDGWIQKLFRLECRDKYT